MPVSYFFDQFRPDQPSAEQVQPSAEELALVRHFRRLSLRLQRSLTELAQDLVEDA